MTGHAILAAIAVALSLYITATLDRVAREAVEPMRVVRAR